MNLGNASSLSTLEDDGNQYSEVEKEIGGKTTAMNLRVLHVCKGYSLLRKDEMSIVSALDNHTVKSGVLFNTLSKVCKSLCVLLCTVRVVQHISSVT